MRTRKKTTKIVIHHSASKKNTSVDRIRKWHVEDNGWSDIGYHYIVNGETGKVSKARDIHRQGAHCPTWNSHSVGICLTGNYENDHVCKVAWTALLSLVEFIQITYGLTWEDVQTHREGGKTACPGKNLQMMLDDYRRRA